MAETDLDLLIGRLAVHYQVLSKEQAQSALLAWQQGGQRGDFGTFLTSEGLIAPEVLQKLLRARAHYLQRADDGSSAPASSLDDTKPTAEARSAGDRADAPAPTLQAAEPPELELGGPPELELDDPSPAAAPRAPAATPASVARPAAGAAAAAAKPVVAKPVAAAAAAEPAAVAAAAEPAVAAAAEPAPVPAAQPAPAPASASPELQKPEALLRLGPDTSLEDLLHQTRELAASDLHLHCGARIKLRIDGRLLDAGEALDRDRAEGLIRGLLDEEQLARVEAEAQIDFAYAIPGVGRFRANVYRQQRGLDAVFRAIAPTAPTLEDLGLPAAFERFASFHQGIVLFTGPAGCGKSSTMAAMVRLISEQRSDHIITIEDPIEYEHPSVRSIVNQRQVGSNTKSFARALRAALREDPDVIVIGELRDLETISLALSAAETGHLVFGTLHTSNAIRTVNRVLGVFPPDEQGQIRMMLSESLRVVVSQRLIPRANGDGRVAATEVLIGTRAVGNLIREQKTFQLSSVMQTGTAQGMCLLDVSLQDLVKRRQITPEAAREHAEKPEAIG